MDMIFCYFRDRLEIRQKHVDENAKMARKLLPMKMAAWHQGAIYERVAQKVRMKPADGIGQHGMIGAFENFIRLEYITVEDQNNQPMRGEIDPTTYIMKMLPVEKPGELTTYI